MEESYADVLSNYASAFDKLGFIHRYLLQTCDVREFGDITRHSVTLEEAALLARRIVSGNKA